MSSRATDQPRRTGDQHYRGLWGAVVLQARDDIQSEPLRSNEYAQAVAFFTSGGQWANTRTMIGDFLDLHRDDLEAFGRRSINARRMGEGLEPLALAELPPVRPAPSRSLEHLLARQPAPEPAPPPRPSPRPAQGRFNPFFPRGVYGSAMVSSA
jgi:hypothetical protein